MRIEVQALKDLVMARGKGMLGGSAGASDIAQEAVLKLFELDSVPRFPDPAAMRSYLWVTAWRLLLQRVRNPFRRHRSLDTASSSQLPSGLVDSATPSVLQEPTPLDLAMNFLPEEERKLLNAAYFERRSVDELAQTHGTSESAIKMRLLRSRRTLAERIQAWERVIS